MYVIAKDITISGRDTGRTSGGGGNSGGCRDLIGKNGGGYPSGSNGYGGDHGGGSGGHSSYSGKHFDNGTPVTRYGRKLVASEAAFKKAQAEQAQAIAQSGLSASAFAAAQATAARESALEQAALAAKVAAEQAILVEKLRAQHFASNWPPCADIGEAIRQIRADAVKVAAAEAQAVANAKILADRAESAAKQAAVSQALVASKAAAHARYVAAEQVKAIAKVAADKELAAIKAIDDAEKIILQTMENERILTLDKISLKNIDMQHLADTLKPINYNLDAILLQNKNLNNLDFFHLMNGITLPNTGISHSVVYINLANNNLGDDAAQIISNALVDEQLTATSVIDVSGNKITEAGEGYLAGAIQSDAVQEIIVLTYKLDENAKMMFGTKEEKIAIFRELLARGAEVGIDNENMVVDNSWLGEAKNFVSGFKTTVTGVFGFAKCKWNPDEIVESYAQGELIAKLPQSLGNFIGNALNVKSIVSCYLGATEEAWLTESGQYLIKHELCVMGELEFCNE